MRIVIAAVAAALIAASCGGSEAATTPATITIERPTRADIPWDETPEKIRSTEQCPAELPVDSITPVDQPLVALRRVAEVPDASALAFSPDGTGYVGTRGGMVMLWRPGTSPTPILDLTSSTTTERDQGLLGLTVINGYLLVNRTDGDNDTVIEAYPLVEGRPTRDEVIELLRADQPQKEHNGGDIVLGPDGHLYLTVGDGGAQGGPFITGRQEPHAFGSLLRFAISFDPTPVLAPAEDNPFAGEIPGSDHTWVWGVRHPYRFTFDEQTGDLWISDVGQQCVEEVTVLPGGGDGGEHLGWNAFEGNLPFVDQEIGSHVPPTFSYGHRDGYCAIIGGHVLRGETLPGLSGKYIFGDFCKRSLVTYDPATGALQEIQRGSVSPVGFVVAPDGVLYVVDIAQGIWRVDPA